MLRRDLREIWNSGSASAEVKESCLQWLLEARPKEARKRGLHWKPAGRAGAWLVIVLAVLAVIVPAGYLAHLYGFTGYVVELVSSVIPTRDGDEAASEPPTTVDIPTTTEPQQLSYKPLAAKYVQAIAEDWDMIRCEEEDISYMVMFMDKPEDLSCALTDLDGNGVQEMIVTDGNLIYDLYTCSGGEYVHILSGAERDSYTLTADNTIVNVSSGGAGNTLYRFYMYYGTSLISLELVLCDASRDPAAPWFRGIDDPQVVTPITEREAREIINMYPPVPIPSSVITIYD